MDSQSIYSLDRPSARYDLLRGRQSPGLFHGSNVPARQLRTDDGCKCDGCEWNIAVYIWSCISVVCEADVSSYGCWLGNESIGICDSGTNASAVDSIQIWAED